MPTKYPAELKTRALRLLADHLENNPNQGIYTACKEIGTRLGIGIETLRKWHKQAEIDNGTQPGITTDMAAENTVWGVEVITNGGLLGWGRGGILRSGSHMGGTTVQQVIDGLTQGIHIDVGRVNIALVRILFMPNLDEVLALAVDEDVQGRHVPTESCSSEPPRKAG